MRIAVLVNRQVQRDLADGVVHVRLPMQRTDISTAAAYHRMSLYARELRHRGTLLILTFWHRVAGVRSSTVRRCRGR